MGRTSTVQFRASFGPGLFPLGLDYNFKDLDFETQQQLLDLCDQVRIVFV